MPFVQAAHAGPLDSRDVDEHVLAAAVIGLDEAVALGLVEPLHGACSNSGVLVIFGSLRGGPWGPNRLRLPAVPQGSLGTQLVTLENATGS